MSLAKEELFNELLLTFLDLSEDVEAVIVSDHEGFIIAGEKKKSVDLELVSVLTALINPILERMRNEFSFRKFGSASFDTEHYRFLFISIDEETTLSLVLNTLASIDKVSPYAFFLAEKVAQIIFAQEGDQIQISIPNFEVEADVSEASGRVKEQIYQLRLESGNKYRFKFVIIGDREVGKTSIIRRFVENKFSNDYRSTLGLNVTSHSIEFYGNEVVFVLFDIGAQEYFKRFRKTYYQGAQAAFIVFDLTNEESFKNVKLWYDELQLFIENREIPVVIVGNKTDLENQRIIEYQNGVELVNAFLTDYSSKDFSYIETSALSGENVEDAFSLIAYHYIVKTKEREEEVLKQDLMNLINSILEKKKKLTLSFITVNPYWSPGLQILNEINALCECDKIYDDKETKYYEYSNGLAVKNFLFEKFNVFGSDGVLIIFDARDRNQIDSKWREIVIRIINDLEENKVALIGIRVSEESDWSKIIDQFDVNEYLEKKFISLLFFKISFDYRLEIYDQLEVMLNTIKDFS
ncbi:MAG: GTP-binding protein [Candidatus Hodarchaeota archaeon]